MTSPMILNKVVAASGFSLIEVLVALGIISLAVGLAGSGIFQVLSFERFWQDDMAATGDLRRAGSRFAGDALNAEDAVDSLGQRVGCGPGASSSTVTLSWTDTTGSPHTATYSLSGGSLIRVFDGNQNKLARRVVANSLEVSLCQRMLIMDLEVKAGRNTTENIRLQTHLRKLTSN